MATSTYIIIMAVCLVLSAYFSATETAFSSANSTRLKTLAEKGNKNAALACRLLGQYDKLLSTILIGNNIVNILMASIGTVLFVRCYGDAGATISTVVVTVVVLIFGEISPKSIAKDCAERFAMRSAPILQVFLYILTPLNFLFSLWKKLLAKVFRLNAESKMSQEELLMLVDEVQQRHHGHLATGIFGTRYLLETLSRYGRADGVEFVVKDFMDQHPLWKWMDGYLEDRPTQPWTLFD